MNQFWRQAYTKGTTHNLAKQIVYKIIIMALNIEKCLYVQMKDTHLSKQTTRFSLTKVHFP